MDPSGNGPAEELPRVRAETAEIQTEDMELAELLVDERPLPHDHSGEDVFGHGGDLDQPMGVGTGYVATIGDDDGDSTTVPCVADVVMHGAAHQTARASRRRVQSQAAEEPRDFVAEAVDRLGQSLSRRDADAAGRMERLRRRVQAREAARDEGDRLHCEADGHSTTQRRSADHGIDGGTEDETRKRLRRAHRAADDLGAAPADHLRGNRGDGTWQPPEVESAVEDPIGGGARKWNRPTS